ncbi:MAG: DUF6155 family protein [Lachnospiraceae bacterium]|nr:DUF6155 family protein [Lachnospiraceae bacterium]
MAKAKNLTTSELKKCLRDVSWNQLESIICNLYRDSDQAKLYFNSVFNEEGSQEEILENYEKKLSRCFAFSNPYSPDMKTGRKIVSEVEKLASPRIASGVILRFVEMGTDFTNTYGDINESFYNTLISAFSRFVNVINAETTDALYEEFEERIDSVVAEASGIGWGYGDEMESLREQIVWANEEE